MIDKLNEVMKYSVCAHTQTVAASGSGANLVTFDAAGCEWVALMVAMGVTDVITTVQVKESTDGTTAAANITFATSSLALAANGDSTVSWILIDAKRAKRILSATFSCGTGTSAIFSAHWFGLGPQFKPQTAITSALTIA